MGFVFEVFEANENQPISRETLEARLEHWQELYDRRDEFASTAFSGVMFIGAGVAATHLIGRPLTYQAILQTKFPFLSFAILSLGVIGAFILILSLLAVALAVMNYRKLCVAKEKELYE